MVPTSALPPIEGRAVALAPMVLLYLSPSTKAYQDSGKAGFTTYPSIWQTFLRKYRIPFQNIASVEQLEASTPGVLLLPSLVALSQREKQAIQKFRASGGSVLSTWLTGVRDESGGWQGFGFMQNVLNVEVVGDTEPTEEISTLMPYGDSPITYSLLAGQRLWMERVKGMYPLRLSGRAASAQIMDWGRTSVMGKSGAIITFDEQRQSTGVLSRSVTLGYTERLWLSTEPKVLEAIAYQAMTWLLRQSAVHVAAWPFPYTAALSVLVSASDVLDSADLKFADVVEKAGMRASYYVLSNNLKKSMDALKKLQAKGHEIGYMGDQFGGFRGLPEATQSKRLTAALQEMKEAGVSPGPDYGFHAPMEAQDKTTELLLNQLGFSHQIGFLETSDIRVPMLIPRAAGAANPAKPMVILPRTISSPEDLMAEEPEEGFKQFLAEFELSKAMGSLALVRFPNQSVLTEVEVGNIFKRFKESSADVWIATNGEVARWWRERDRISAEIDTSSAVLRLSVTVSGTERLSSNAAVMVNLPYAQDTLRLIPDGDNRNTVKIQRIDPWRALVSLDKLPPGKYRWMMQFERSAGKAN